MNPVDFPESNKTCEGTLDDSKGQVTDCIRAYVGDFKGGTCDGELITVVAWQPTPEELEELKNGALIFVTYFSPMPGHTLQTSFYHATHA